MLRRFSASLRALWIGSVVVFLVVGSAPQANAHSAGNAPSSNYVARIAEITREDGVALRPGEISFDLRSIEATSRLELTWRGGPELSIPDYDGNPYLRVGREGVFENEQSRAVYLNRDRNGATNVPENLNPSGPPVWKRLSSKPVARWHDHRGHRMGGDPPQVRTAPDKAHLVQRETVTILSGASPDGRTTADTVAYEATVEVRWVPGPSKLPWIAGSAVLAIGVAAMSAVVGRSDRGRTRLRPVVLVCVVALVIADVVHLIGISLGIRGTFSQGLTRMIGIGFPSFAAWIASAIGMILFLRKRADGLYLVTFGAGLMAMVGGFADLSALSSTSVPFAFPTTVARIVITLTIGFGVGLVFGGVLLTRPLPDPSDTAELASSFPRTESAV